MICDRENYGDILEMCKDIKKDWATNPDSFFYVRSVVNSLVNSMLHDDVGIQDHSGIPHTREDIESIGTEDLLEHFYEANTCCCNDIDKNELGELFIVAKPVMIAIMDMSGTDDIFAFFGGR